MICKPCADGADLWSSIKEAPEPDPELTGVVPSIVRVMIRELHDQCKGCDCQHQMIKVVTDG